MTITVVVADDHLVVRRGLRALLESEQGISVIGEASDGAQALEAVARLAPDVLVLALVMPGAPGLDVIKQMAPQNSSTRVVVLSMHAGGSHVVGRVASGATSYVVQDSSSSELLEAVRR